MPDNPYFPKRYDFTRAGSQIKPPATSTPETHDDSTQQAGIQRALNRLRTLRTPHKPTSSKQK